MIKIKKISCNEKGVSIIEALVSIAVISFVTVSIYLALSGAVKNMGEAKHRTGAIALANEKMEILRSLPYEEVGVIGGIVDGPVVAQEEVNKNGFKYTVKTDVRYVDDPFDGTGDEDSVSTDYKKAQVTVEWQALEEQESVEFFSIFVPDGIENNAGGGTLAINTINASGEIVPDAQVILDSLEDSPEIYYTAETNASGSLTLQGVPEQSYRISLSKSDFEDVSTYPNPPESSFNPVNSDVIIEEGDFYSKDFIINKTGNLKIRALDIYDESIVEDLEVHLEGGKKIGNSPTTYNLNDTSSTDSSGEIDYGEVSPGPYEILNAGELETSIYKYIGTSDEVDFSVASEEDKMITLLFAEKEKPSLLVDVFEQDTEDPISGVSVNLTSTEMDQTITTGESGWVYFPDKTDPATEMENKEYQLSISKDGYQDVNQAVNIDDLTTVSISLSEE
ncbi:MAG: carboxypeptidase-like regulatory domain-containing protein [Candidatus Moraniibacteriota bacterium]